MDSDCDPRVIGFIVLFAEAIATVVYTAKFCTKVAGIHLAFAILIGIAVAFLIGFLMKIAYVRIVIEAAIGLGLTVALHMFIDNQFSGLLSDLRNSDPIWYWTMLIVVAAFLIFLQIVSSLLILGESIEWWEITNWFYFHLPKRKERTNKNKSSDTYSSSKKKQHVEDEQEPKQSEKQYFFDADVLFLGCQTLEEVKQRYRELVKMFHPDSPNGNTWMMQQINEVYEQLKNDTSVIEKLKASR